MSKEKIYIIHVGVFLFFYSIVLAFISFYFGLTYNDLLTNWPAWIPYFLIFGVSIVSLQLVFLKIIGFKSLIKIGVLLVCVLGLFHLLLILPLLITIAFFTLFERKGMAAIQRRRGPNIVGAWGFLQPLADGLKLIIKELLIPRKANLLLYFIAPVLTFFLSLLNWAVIPFDFNIYYVDLNMSVLYVLAVSSLGVYGTILSGWSSNSKYAVLGGLRAAAQMISYEITISLCILPVICLTGSLNLLDIVFIQNVKGLFLFPLLPTAIIFLISMLAETNRAPFDMPEAEAEIVAGYNVEYGAMIFAMFFLGEYSNMILMAALFVLFFLGGSYPSHLFIGFLSYIQNLGGFILIPTLTLGPLIFAIKVSVVCYFFILVRSMLPRYRYDQLMTLNWKKLLPVTLGFLVFVSSLIFSLELVDYEITLPK